jgi:uncharacterized SAM-dependent methyltransferase
MDMTVPETERLQFMQDLQTALSQTPKRISPKYFYDQAGSALFDRICVLPEYYPTRTELSILQSHAADMSACMGENPDIIEFGAGSLQKIRYLLNVARNPARYVPMDISGPHLKAASAELQTEFVSLKILPVVADYTNPWHLPSALSGTGKRVAFFPGSTIGNFSPAQAHTFFQNCVQHLSGGALLHFSPPLGDLSFGRLHLVLGLELSSTLAISNQVLVVRVDVSLQDLDGLPGATLVPPIADELDSRVVYRWE